MNLHFRQPIMSLAITVLLLASSTTLGAAKCASGSPPDYADIEAVMLKQTGCGGTRVLPPYKVTKFDCSMFYAFFWEPPMNDAQYAQYNLAGSVGTYRLGINLQRVIQVLKIHKFFAISPPDLIVTDTTESVLSVKRCAVVTKIRVFNRADDEEPATRRLFEDLRRLIQTAPKRRVSPEANDFSETGLFYP